MQLVSLPQLFLGSVPRSSGYPRQGMAPPLSRLRGAVGLVRLFSSLFAPLNVQYRGTFPCRARSPGQVLQRRAVHLGTAGTSALSRHCPGGQGRTSTPSPQPGSRRKPCPALPSALPGSRRKVWASCSALRRPAQRPTALLCCSLAVE